MSLLIAAGLLILLLVVLRVALLRWLSQQDQCRLVFSWDPAYPGSVGNFCRTHGEFFFTSDCPEGQR